MPQQSQTDRQYRTPRWLLGIVVAFSVLLLGSIVVSSVLLQGISGEATEYTQAQLEEHTLGMAHDELIMLIISMVVVVQIAATYKFLKWIPFRPLLISSFGAMALSSVCTVVEGLFFHEALNILEHLSIMASGILLVVWCGLVLGRSKQETV